MFEEMEFSQLNMNNLNIFFKYSTVACRIYYENSFQSSIVTLSHLPRSQFLFVYVQLDTIELKCL